MLKRRTVLLGMGALACTPTGARDGTPPPRIGPRLLPGERLLAFVHWPEHDTSLTLYASGHLDHRTRTPAGVELRLGDASYDDVLRVLRLLGSPAFAKAPAPTSAPVASLYAPELDRSVVSGSEAPAITEVFSVVEALRVHAVQTGIDPFSHLAHRVVSPMLVHTLHRPEDGYVRELAVFDNGALELRRIPDRFGADTRQTPWATSRRVDAGALLELSERVADFDAEVQPPRPRTGLPPEHAFVTAHTRRHLDAIESEAARALVASLDRLVSSVETRPTA